MCGFLSGITRRKTMLSFARLYVLLVLCAFPSLAKATAEVHLADDSLLTASSPPPAPTRVPVLFVHGHSFDLLDIGNTTDDPLNPNYKKNWWNALNRFAFIQTDHRSHQQQRSQYRAILHPFRRPGSIHH